MPIGRTAPFSLSGFMTFAIGAWMAPCGDPDGYSETITATYLRTIAADISHDDHTVTMADRVARLEKRLPSWRTSPPRPPSTC